MLKGIVNTVLAGAITLAAGPAQADWQQSHYDNGAIFSGSAGPEGRLFSLRCTNLSRQGLDLVMMGSHEETQTAPGQLLVSVAPSLVPVRGIEYERSDLIVWADGTGYRLPRVSFNEFSGDGWETRIGIADPMVLALMSASTVIVGAAAGPHYQLDSANMGTALRETVQFCLGEYARMGAPVPPALAGFMAPAVAPTPPPHNGEFQIPPQVVSQVTAQSCFGGPVSISSSAYQAGDLDGDGVPDVAVNYGDVTCPNERQNPNCGAANCTLEVYVSSRGYQRPFQMLGTFIAIVPHARGGLALEFGGTYSVCGESGCDIPWRWTGTTFEQRP